MTTDAARAMEIVRESSPWRAPVTMMYGIALGFGGHRKAAAALDEAIHVSRELSAAPALTLALSQRAYLADLAGNHEVSARLISEALEVVGNDLTRYPQAALCYALDAVRLSRGDDREAANAALAAAGHFRPLVGAAIPWLAVQYRIELARAAIALSAVDQARTILREVAALGERLPPQSPVMVTARRLTAALVNVPSGPDSSALLTTAELRLLPHLPSHLTFEEIGAHLHVSKNTIKTQALSIYRKLGVTSRSMAVDTSRSLGLIGD
jgi:LuxR family maltose regulon positive regulatory protein